jgi:hypothetical protein
MTEAQAADMLQLLTWINDNIRLMVVMLLLILGVELYHVGRIVFRG